MDFQRLQFAAYLRDAALKKVAEDTKHMPPAAAKEYRDENLIEIATEIFKEVDDIANSAQDVENERASQRLAEWASGTD
ncbi:hypothetical protein [Massilia sp. CFBP9026]|uniref:hypothetical protein n=1 Tax=Massilia sp. CFBP9026 TaxID=3096536 RepID=UPI002A69992C|nr:hypothetical protein [Massilia sp. CFBP9026]MDY0961759.1 hypothetical protein [Massilia sp. CFBP9026]